jgi:hypothetical protein
MGFITDRLRLITDSIFTITDRLMCTRVIAHFLTFKKLEKLHVTNRLWIKIITTQLFVGQRPFLTLIDWIYRVLGKRPAKL